jgi:hypothetical protein
MPRFSKNRLSKNRLSKKQRRYKKRATRRLKGGIVLNKNDLDQKRIKQLLSLLAKEQEKKRDLTAFVKSEKKKNIQIIVQVLNEKYEKLTRIDASGKAVTVNDKGKLTSYVQNGIDTAFSRATARSSALEQLKQFARSMEGKKEMVLESASEAFSLEPTPVDHYVDEDFIVRTFAHLKSDPPAAKAKTTAMKPNPPAAAKVGADETYTLSNDLGEQYRKPNLAPLVTGTITYNSEDNNISFAGAPLGIIKVLLTQLTNDNKMLTIYFITDTMMTENPEHLKDKDTLCKLFHSFTIQLTDDKGEARDSALKFSRAIVRHQEKISNESYEKISSDASAASGDDDDDDDDEEKDDGGGVEEQQRKEEGRTVERNVGQSD